MRVVLWCNGSMPSNELIDSIIEDGTLVIGVDGGGEKAKNAGIQVSEVIGDLDSIDRTKWEGRTLELKSQSRSDLAKSIELMIERGFSEIDILGVDGGATDHVLGNWAALCESSPGATVRLHHENSFSHFHHPDDGALEMHLNEGVEFSVFAFEPTKIWISGAKWELIGESLSFSTRGLRNQGLGGMISIKSEAPVVLISQR